MFTKTFKGKISLKVISLSEFIIKSITLNSVYKNKISHFGVFHLKFMSDIFNRNLKHRQ